MTPWYTDAEIDSLCEGLTQHAARVKYLRRLGLHVTRRPNGRPLVLRAHAEAVLSGQAQLQTAGPEKPAAAGPDAGALISFLAARRATHKRA